MSTENITTDIDNEDEEYNSSEDEDFNPDGAEHEERGSDASDSSSDSEDDEEDASKTVKKKTKKKDKEESSKDEKSATAVAKDARDEIDSGDEAVVQPGKRKRGAGGKHADGDYAGADEEGGEGGLIKTRAQRAREEVHKQKMPRATTASSSVDIDALWKSMNADPVPPKKPIEVTATSNTSVQSGKLSRDTLESERAAVVPTEPVAASKPTAETVHSTVEPVVKDGMVNIKRTYEFAGEVTTEERLVPADSFEARAYLASLSNDNKPSTEATNNDDVTPAAGPKKPPLRRPTKRVSQFEPGNAAKLKATKLTTLEKSRLDWAGYVDKQGLAEELDKQKKAGTGYLEREDFLNRVADRTSRK